MSKLRNSKVTLFGLITLLILLFISSCSHQENGNMNDLDGLTVLEVDFDVPETAEVNETITLKATVTYGGEPVTDPRQVDFEIWERGKQDESEWIEAENHGDGTYTTEVTFDRDGIFEMYVHTTAHGLHVMPKREITVGEGGDYDDVDEANHFHTEEFDLHFMNAQEMVVGEENDLLVHVSLHDEPLTNARVRYEIWRDGDDKHEWLDAEEIAPGEYVTTHTFKEPGSYQLQIHVEDEQDLHEHVEFSLEVID